MKVKFTRSGRTDFLDAVAYIRRERPLSAAKFHQRANEKLKRLRRFPESGRRIPEFADSLYREVLVNPYRFFYRIQGKTVWIVAVWHDAQLPKEPEG